MTWPAVFDGVGALVVNCALDPNALVEKVNRHARSPLTWVAFKVGGTDVADDTETRHCIAVWRNMGLKTGPWTYCSGPPVWDFAEISGVLSRFGPYDFAVYDVEAEYKTDEAGPDVYGWPPDVYGWPADLVTLHAASAKVPAAVTSYGAIPGYGNSPSSIDFAAFARAGWTILAQCYDSFSPGDEVTYATDSGAKFPGPYPRNGIHRVLRSLAVGTGESVFRPEGLDG